MPSIAHLLAPLALLLPFSAGERVATEALGSEWVGAMIPVGSPLVDSASEPGAFSDFLVEGLGDDGWNQVRIEQRMIIRIAPRGPGQVFAAPPGPPQPLRFYERKTSKCLPIANIAGVQLDSPDRLLLVTRNRKLIGASLDKSCRARDFYSGFYVERNEDGQLCAGRDTIHSRAGTNCAITRLRELVPDDD